MGKDVELWENEDVELWERGVPRATARTLWERGVPRVELWERGVPRATARTFLKDAVRHQWDHEEGWALNPQKAQAAVKQKVDDLAGDNARLRQRLACLRRERAFSEKK